jgi:Flp pilus assembly protein TadG
MKKTLTHSQKSPAQAMVEFALVLPILLLLIYGLLEVGRLLFIYSSVVSAARQAARYASTTGVNAGGIFRYRDCDGMRDAAQRVAFIDDFADADIEIWHDEGEGVNEISYCPAGTSFDTTFTPTTGNINRVRVRVHTQYTPIVPIVPLEPFEIESISARTILVSVPIVITAAPQGWNPNNSPIPPDTATPTITFTPSITPTIPTPTITNTPTITYTPTITLTPSKTGSPTKTGTATNTPTQTGTAIVCDVRHNPLKTSPFGMTIYNNHPSVTLHITQIQVYWDPSSPAGQALEQVSLGGVTIWNGTPLTGSPALFTIFSGDISIGPTSDKLLQVSFSKNYKSNGLEQILVNFAENGCPTLDSSNDSQLQ